MKSITGRLQRTDIRGYNSNQHFVFRITDANGNIAFSMGGRDYLFTVDDRDKLVQFIYENFELVTEPKVQLKAQDY